MLTRIIILLIGFNIAFLAGRFGMLAKSKWELSSKQQIMRYAAAFVAAFGLWISMSAITYHPSNEAKLECFSLEDGIAKAEEQNVPLLIDFWAEWCTACHELREETLDSAEVLAVSDTFVCAAVDVTQNTPENLALQEYYRVQSLPTVAFTSPDGTFLPDVSITGLVGPDVVLNAIRVAETGESIDGRSDFEKALQDKGIFWAFLIVFIAGIGASLTPCVYPLIPITIGVFGAAEADSKLQGFLLSLVYVSGIAITYSILGVSAALAGGLFGGLLQNPLVLLGFAIFFVVFAMSLLGLYEFRLPGGLQDKLASSGGKGFAGAFVMGLVAGIIAAPCVGPILSGVLLFIAESRNALLGGALMMTFAVGMGLLFMILGTFSSLIHKLPGSGGWMDIVKSVFGVIFILVAIFYAADALPVLHEPYILLWDLLSKYNI